MYDLTIYQAVLTAVWELDVITISLKAVLLEGFYSVVSERLLWSLSHCDSTLPIDRLWHLAEIRAWFEAGLSNVS